jgi:hypothetical protein
MGELVLPCSVVIAKSWKADECNSAKSVALSSRMRCNAAMLATKPMPGNPSIKTGLLSSGLSWICKVQTKFGRSCRRVIVKRSQGNIKALNYDNWRHLPHLPFFSKAETSHSFEEYIIDARKQDCHAIKGRNLQDFSEPQVASAAK